MTVTPVTSAPNPSTRALLSQIGTALPAPVHDHAGLGKREGQESAHGKKRDQAIGDAAKQNEQARGEHRQDKMP